MKLIVFLVLSTIQLNAKEIQIYDKKFKLEEFYQSKLRVLSGGHCKDFDRFKKSWEKQLGFCQTEQSSCKFLKRSVLDYEKSVPIFQGVVEIEDFLLQDHKNFQVELSKNAFLETVDVDFSHSDLFSYLSNIIEMGLKKESFHFITKSRAVTCALYAKELFLKGQVSVFLKAKKSYPKELTNKVLLTHKTLKKKTEGKLNKEDMNSFFFGFLIGQALGEEPLFKEVGSLFERYWVEGEKVNSDYFEVSEKELMNIMFPEKIKEQHVNINWEGK